jgi:hypothetical protein
MESPIEDPCDIRSCKSSTDIVIPVLRELRRMGKVGSCWHIVMSVLRSLCVIDVRSGWEHDRWGNASCGHQLVKVGLLFSMLLVVDCSLFSWRGCHVSEKELEYV